MGVAGSEFVIPPYKVVSYKEVARIFDIYLCKFDVGVFLASHTCKFHCALQEYVPATACGFMVDEMDFDRAFCYVRDIHPEYDSNIFKTNKT